MFLLNIWAIKTVADGQISCLVQNKRSFGNRSTNGVLDRRFEVVGGVKTSSNWVKNNDHNMDWKETGMGLDAGLRIGTINQWTYFWFQSQRIPDLIGARYPASLPEEPTSKSNRLLNHRVFVEDILGKNVNKT